MRFGGGFASLDIGSGDDTISLPIAKFPAAGTWSDCSAAVPPLSLDSVKLGSGIFCGRLLSFEWVGAFDRSGRSMSRLFELRSALVAESSLCCSFYSCRSIALCYTGAFSMEDGSDLARPALLKHIFSAFASL